MATLSLTVVFLAGCAEEPLPQRRLTADDCLRDVRMDDIDDAKRRCDRVVAAFPRDPEPLNDRFLLHTLDGDDEAACRDIAAAVKLAKAVPPGRLDPMLAQDLKLRQAACSSGEGAAAESPTR
jgi:hypothetical protein